MTSLVANASWDDVVQLETTTKAKGGSGQIMNSQAQALLNRTAVGNATTSLTAALEPTIAPGTTSQYWRGDKTWQTLNKASVGLANVDNTSDVNKPVSTATSAAISSAVATKEPTITAGTTLQYWRGDKTWQSLTTDVKSIVLPAGATRVVATASTTDVVLTQNQTKSLTSLLSGFVVAPSVLDSTNAPTLNGASLYLASGATMTVADSAWAYLTQGVSIFTGISGTSTVAFSGSAVKEGPSGTSAANVTLQACGMYALTQSPTGSPVYRIGGGPSI